MANKGSDAVQTALKAIQASFGGKGRKLGQDALDMAVDAITSKGTDDDAMTALAHIPAKETYSFPRMMLLRRLLLVKERFLLRHRKTFQGLRLLNAEYQAMVREFGEQAVIDFLRPDALRSGGASQETHACM